MLLIQGILEDPRTTTNSTGSTREESRTGGPRKRRMPNLAPTLVGTKKISRIMANPLSTKQNLPTKPTKKSPTETNEEKLTSKQTKEQLTNKQINRPTKIN